MKRKSPTKHLVKSHTRDRGKVKSYVRGSGKPTKRPSRVVGKQIFSWRVGSDEEDTLTGTDIKFQWHHYREDAQQRVWMDPLFFLDLCQPPMHGGSFESPFGFLKSSIDGIQKALIDNDEDLMTLRIDVRGDTGQVVGHEGRHRAYWAWKKGLKELPVIIWTEDKDGYVEKFDNPPSPDKLIPQILESGGPLSQHKDRGVVHYADRTAKDVALGYVKGNWTPRYIDLRQLEKEGAKRLKKQIEEEEEERRKKLRKFLLRKSGRFRRIRKKHMGT